jgi:Dihydroorotate dehydrogenase
MKGTDISVNYAGLKLKNPIMVSSSGLTDTPHKIKILEKCGASAAVLKSLFEEQIMMNIQNELQTNEYNYTEAPDFLRSFITADHVGNYLRLIEESKKAVKIPIIASINACSLRSWIKFAKQIENAGADAIEVNIMLINTEKN